MSFISVEDIGITAVSHSRMKTHESCPRKAKYKFIDRLKEPGNEAMERGLKLHKELENWMKNGTPIPRTPIYNKIREHISDFYNCGESATNPVKYIVKAEQQAAFDKDWNPCDWFAANAWMRVVYDYSAWSPCGTHATLGDYKTGKIYDDHDQQADLYALSAFKSGAKRVDVYFYYLDQNVVQPYHYEERELPSLEAAVAERADKVTSDRVFPTNPSWRCRYCHFRRENGGPCAH